jgi:ABC-type multidrug transport system fused ATPase/permease subunit
VNNLKSIAKDVITISRITKVTKKKLRLLLSVFLSNITVFADILIILVFASLLTSGTDQDSTYYIFIKLILDNIILLPLLVVVRTLIVLAEKVNIHSLQLQVEKNLKLHILSEIYKKGNYSIADATFYINTLSGHLSYFYGALAGMANNIIQIIVYASFLIYTDFQTITLFAIGGIIMFFPTRFLLKKARHYMHSSYIFAQETGRDIQRVIQNLFLIKILRTSKAELELYNNTITKFQQSQFRNLAYGALNHLFPNFITVFTISVLVAFYNFAKYLTLEFLGITLRLVQTIGNANGTLNMLVNSSVHIEKFIQFENNKLVINPEYYKQGVDSPNAVELKDVSFKYFNSDEFIFDNLNLSFSKNKHTILTGPNGSGKSTLLGIISQIYYPEIGEVTLSANKIGYVGVTPLIIDGSLRENLIYGNDDSEINDEKLIDLLREFKLFDDDNYDLNYEVSNRSLSSGQMQKISFMRSLLSDVDLLLLDESTSNLDTSSRELIFNILKEKSLTIINSTHNHEEFKFDEHIKIEYKNEKRVFTKVL